MPITIRNIEPRRGGALARGLIAILQDSTKAVGVKVSKGTRKVKDYREGGCPASPEIA